MFNGLRIPAMLRRIARALEDSNKIARERIDREFPTGHKPKKYEFSRPTAEQWQENYDAKRRGQ